MRLTKDFLEVIKRYKITLKGTRLSVRIYKTEFATVEEFKRYLEFIKVHVECEEDLVEKFGEQYRPLINDALNYLDREEPKWGLKKPINRINYITELIKKAKPNAQSNS